MVGTEGCICESADGASIEQGRAFRGTPTVQEAQREEFHQVAICPGEVTSEDSPQLICCGF